MSTLTNVVVFEGTSYIPDAKVFRATQLTNPADELDKIKPSGDYSGRTDEIISSLISDYCTYVTAGTLSNGTAMGTITFSGDKTLRRILHQFAEIDGFTWYLKPQGQLFYDDGTNDTGVDITTDDVGNTRPSDVDAFYQNTGINAVIVRGAYVGSVRVESAEQTDEADILLNGKTRIIVTDSTIDTTALANSKASAILTREGSNPLTARFGWRNTTKGLPQKGQSITLKVDTTDVNITSQQFILDKINYDGKTDQQAIECSTGLVFKIGDDNERLPEENSQQIAQVAGTVETVKNDGVETSEAWYLKTSGDTDDYIEFSMDSNTPMLSIIGGTGYLRLESDHVGVVALNWWEDLTHRGSIYWDKTNDKFILYAVGGSILLQPNADTDDYLYFSTASNIAYLLPVENKMHYLGSASLSFDHVYADDFDNTSPFKNFIDPLTDLKKIKGNLFEDAIDYESLPEWVRSHSRNPNKHIRDSEGKIIKRAEKDVIEEKGWSINRMCIFLYQTCQKLLERIEDLENS